MKSKTSKVVLLIVLGFLSLTITAFYSIRKTTEGILKELGLQDDEANSYFAGFMIDGSTGLPSVKAAYKWNIGKRKEALAELVQIAKVYFASQEFKELYAQSYEQAINSAKEIAENPNDPGLQQLKWKIDHLEKEVNQIDAEWAKASEEDKKKYGQEVEAKHKELSELKKKYEKETQPEDMFPKDPKQMLAIHLKEFLKESSDVDYTAQLRKEDNKMVFVNEEYEAKSPLWKRCFRAGKELTETARQAAQTWLKELQVP